PVGDFHNREVFDFRTSTLAITRVVRQMRTESFLRLWDQRVDAFYRSGEIIMRQERQQPRNFKDSHDVVTGRCALAIAAGHRQQRESGAIMAGCLCCGHLEWLLLD